MTFSPHMPPLHKATAGRCQPTLEALREGLALAAVAVRIDPAALPIFERLDREIRNRECEGSSLDRALAMASGFVPHSEPQIETQFVIRKEKS